MTILVIGASGMLGNAVLRYFSQIPGCTVVGSVRSEAALNKLPPTLRSRVVVGADVDNEADLRELFAKVRPTVAINCVGLVKQLPHASDALAAIPINSLLPHRLLKLCKGSGARLVHISTDCVFSGATGMYSEDDPPDAKDLYGLSKLLGEVSDSQAITLRTSMIGHELDGEHGLVGWFLAQRGHVKGFRRAIFSGLPTVELARVIGEFVLPRPELHGVYHVSAEPINKYELLKLIKRVYGVAVEIDPDDNLVIDRSLDSSRFRRDSGYSPPAWPQLVQAMRDFH
jgi:dTDP-4-dehydrorhamnose reductase